MSAKRFIIFLQELLSMVSPEDDLSRTAAKNALISVVALAFASHKADAITLRIMRCAEDSFDYLVVHAEDFAGKPGDFVENEKRRRRLLQMLNPSC